MTEAYLIDTCVMIWVAHLKPLSSQATAVMEPKKAKIGVSAMSAWEVGMLVAKGRLPVTRDVLVWFEEFCGQLEAEVMLVTPKILIASSNLPRPLHNDPVDRILIATAREHDLTIITRDRAILDYGAAGHVRTLAC